MKGSGATNRIWTKVIVPAALWLVMGFVASASNATSIIPAPQKMELHDGTFPLGPDTKILTDFASRETGNYLAARLRRATGFSVNSSRRFRPTNPVAGAILLTTRGAAPGLDAEGYELVVATNSVVIRARTQAGLFYGVQTLLQLLPPEIFATNPVARVDWPMPCLQVEDSPRFKWRGMLLDVSRHFFDKQEIERLLDEMALHKLNTFHWHLVDDQGWRIEIKKYPRLTAIGAWRKESPVNVPETNHVQPAWLATSAYGPDDNY